MYAAASIFTFQMSLQKKGDDEKKKFTRKVASALQYLFIVMNESYCRLHTNQKKTKKKPTFFNIFLKKACIFFKKMLL